MVKIKLFLADTKLYVSLDLNHLTGNTHLFKLKGELLLENITLKKNWIWHVSEIKWGNTCIVLNNKEIHLPTMLLVPFIHKLKVRKLFGKRDLMYVYIMLKQRKLGAIWKVSGNNTNTHEIPPAILSQNHDYT